MVCPASNSSWPTSFICIALSEKFQDCLVGMYLGGFKFASVMGRIYHICTSFLMLCVNAIHG